MIARVSIRADICIALRIIALQEYYRQTQEIINEFYENLLNSQEPLGEEFQKVLNDNIDQLYVED